jgi:RND superfamily putative drug exporter
VDAIMFAALGRLAHRRAKTVLLLAGLLVAVSAVWGSGVFDALTTGGFQDEGSESARADERLESAFGRQSPDVIVLYASDGMTVDDPAYEAAVSGSLGGLSPDDVTRQVTYWDGEPPALVSEDRTATYAMLTLAGEDDDARSEVYKEIRDQIGADGRADGLSVSFGGAAAVGTELGEQVGSDIGRAEGLAFPLLLLLLLVVFGTVWAAAMPLMCGIVAVLGSLTVLRAFSLATDVSVFSINIVTMLGLGLAIDYSLFIVSRFREELARGLDVPDAIERTVATAGRTVAFSGLVVGISLAGLMLFPQVFLRSMGMGGLAAVIVAMAASLTVLPAVLSLLGHRVNALRVPFLRRRTRAAEGGTGGAGGAGGAGGPWYRLARGVMRRPVLWLAVIVLGLVALGLPFRNVNFGSVDERALPEGTASRVVSEELDRNFPAGDADAIEVVVDGADRAAVGDYRTRLGELPGVADVGVGAQDDRTALLLVRHDLGLYSTEARELVGEVRGADAPPGTEVLVGGGTAELADQLDGVASRLPWMIGFIALVTFVALFMAFGSLLLPLKALVANALSLSASFGAIVWIFQYGHLSDWLGFTPTGSIDANQPVLMFAIAFGLSMDYEVFLLSRVREEWDRTGDNAEAVATGLQRTGSIITSAALLLIVVVGAFATSGITFIKMIGLGLFIAIAVDAVLVRTLLVPAAMRLLGPANWWAPGPLARWWRRHGHRDDPLRLPSAPDLAPEAARSPAPARSGG